MSTTIGANAATKTSRERVYQADGSMNETFMMDSSKEAGFIGTYTLGQASGTLKLGTIKSTVTKGRCTVTLGWVTEAKFNRFVGSPGTFRSSDSAVQSIPISEHPDYSAGESEAAGVPVINGKQKAEGVTSFLLPGPTYTRSRSESSFTFSEANLIANIGTRNAPTSMTNPTADMWLKTGLSASEEGDIVRITETWTYNPYGWDTDIYP